MSMLIDSPSPNTLAADSDSGEAKKCLLDMWTMPFLMTVTLSDCLLDDSATKYIHSTNLSYQNQTLISK